MCSPKFCAMRISDDGRRFVEAETGMTSAQIAAGVQEKAREFREARGEIYVAETASG